MRPEVSVVILSHNRKDELARTLESVLRQDYDRMEVLVVDNASSDGTLDMLRRGFPSVSLVALNENIGVKARRAGAERASGKYVVMYDDDSGPSEMDDISRIASFMERTPAAAAMCTSIYRTRSFFSETWGWEEYASGGNEHDGFEGLFIHSSGVVFRREALLETGAFTDDFTWGDAEFDVALDLISSGHRIFYYPRVTTYHRASLSNRNKARFYRKITRNHLLILRKYFPAGRVIEYSLKEILYQLLLSRLHFPFVLLGVADCLRDLPRRRGIRRRAIPAEFRGYLKEVSERRYPWPVAWLRQQLRLRAYRKAKVY